jgi:excisionase family DNA binding protein
METLLSVEQAAVVLGISPWTVRRYVHLGTLKPVRIGRRVLLEGAELRRLIEQCKNQPANQVSASSSSVAQSAPIDRELLANPWATRN